MALFISALRRASRSWALLAAMALIAAPSLDATAQQYKSIPLNIQPAQANVLKAKVPLILRNPGAPAGADLKTLNDFFTYYYSAMTSSAPDQLALLSKTRKDLFQLFLNVPNGAPAPREHVMGLTIKAMKAIAKGNYHPAVRYNATLILGQLDKTPPKMGANAAPPVPLSTATAALVELLDAAAADPAAVAPPVVVGALVGLERHTRLGADPALADQITKAALAAAANEEAPEGVSASVHSWTRALAGRVLANQFAKGLTPAAHESLVKLVLDKKLILDDRCLVVEAIKTPMYKGAQGVKIDEMVAAVGDLAKDVLADETKKAKGYLDKSGIGGAGVDPSAFGGPGGGFGGGGGYRGEMGRGMGGGFEGGGLAALDDTTPHYEKRRMLDRLLAVRDAANALAAAGSPELKTRLDQLTKPIQQVADEAVKPKATDAGVVGSVLELAEEIDRVVADWGPNPAGAAPADEPAEVDPPAGKAPPTAAAGN